MNPVAIVNPNGPLPGAAAVSAGGFVPASQVAAAASTIVEKECKSGPNAGRKYKVDTATDKFIGFSDGQPSLKKRAYESGGMSNDAALEQMKSISAKLDQVVLAIASLDQRLSMMQASK